jgi:NAD(P)-dependent dehydrogenase (short-subunit alcohol dehydrogenase family)
MSAVLEFLASPARLVFRALLRLGSQPLDRTVGNVQPVSSLESLRQAFEGRRALIVGGTRGIGKAVADTLRTCGAHVTVVGRTASGEGGVCADLSTVAGCTAFVRQLPRRPLDFVVFTVGVWPSFSDPYTTEGVEKVVALDLLARHVVLEELAAAGLLSDGCRVQNVLASTQRVPFLTAATVRDRVQAHTAPRSLPYALLPVGVAADAWLQHVATRHPSLRFIGMFPGVVVTDLPLATFPAWAVEALHLLMLPVASSAAETGLAHATVLASPNALRRRTSYFNHLLDGRLAHPLAYDVPLGAWTYDFLEGLRLARQHQTNFEAGKGNALQACVASIFRRPLDAVPDFVRAPEGYEPAIKAWAQGMSCSARKVKLGSDGDGDRGVALPEVAAAGSLVILRGTSPRGDHGHVIVARVGADGRGLTPHHDPHPDGTNLLPPFAWAMLFPGSP